MMGAGPGGLSTAATKAAEHLHGKGVITVASLRSLFGAVVPSPELGNMQVDNL